MTIIHTWQTWWLIVGPKLPDHHLVVTNNVVLSPITEDVYKKIKEGRSPSVTLSVPDHSYVAHYPPKDELKCYHRLQIDIEAESEDDAVELAKITADRLLA